MDDESQHENSGIVEAPPAANVEESSKRHRRTKRGVALAVGGLCAAIAAAWLILFGGGDTNQGPMLDGNEISQGGAFIDGQVEEGGLGGGVRQEVATVQADIEEEEIRQERLESGRSVITFGESLIDDAEESGTSEGSLGESHENRTFGAIAQEPTAPQKPDLGSNPGRQQVRIAGSRRGSGGQASMPGSMAQAVAQEIQRYSEDVQGTSHSQTEDAVYYAPAKVVIPPTFAEGPSAEDMSGYSVGELALPGDFTAAFMENRISSDQPSGRVVATILEGPLEQAKAIGEAKFEGDRLVIRFDRIVTPEGDVLTGVKALAVDPNTMETSLQSGIDRKIFQRYGVPLLYGIAAIGLDYASVKDATTVVEQDLETGETVSRTIRTDPSFGEYMTGNMSDALDEPLGRAANEAASVDPTAWANPGVIGLLFDTAVPAN